jgi:hypothetical protein
MTTHTHSADIVIPTHNHPLLLPYSVKSALSQSVSDIRVIVIGDGVGDDTRSVIHDLMREDSRIEFHDLPKAGRTGEPHRHPIIMSSSARIVAYNGDDDILAPDHLDLTLKKLEDHDVVAPLGTHIQRDGSVESNPWSLAEEPGRTMALNGSSLFSLSGLSHTTTAYRRLPHGWRTTPNGFYTDQYMILQFLEQPWCRFGLVPVPTVAHLADSLRRDMSDRERLEEIMRVNAWLRTADDWTNFRVMASESLRRNAAIHHHGLFLAHQRLSELEATVTSALLSERLLETELNEQRDTNKRLRQKVRSLENHVTALNGTRTIRLRNFLIRNRLVRFLATRRQ